MSWQESSLGTIADMQLGKMLDAKKNDGEYHSYLGNDNIQWDGVNLSEIKEMRFKDSELAKFTLKPGDLLVCEGGDPGRCAIWDSTEEMYYQKALHRVRAHEGVLDNRFLYYFLVHIGSTQEIRQYYTGGATIKHLPKAALERVVVRYPDLETQRRIAGVLSAYDKLIENNRKQIKLLEEAARRLYKEWFVDLRFPGHETTSIVNGLPEGWEYGTLDNLLDECGARIDVHEREAFERYLPIDSLPSKSFTCWDLRPICEAESSLLAFKENDFIFGAMRPYFHKVVVAPYASITRSTCFVLRSKDVTTIYFAYMLLFWEQTIRYAASISAGMTMPYVRWTDLKKMKLVIPRQGVQRSYSSMVASMFREISILEKSVAVAREARDRLLPKLMSGEIEV